jgi:hypothetical protein
MGDFFRKENSSYEAGNRWSLLLSYLIKYPGVNVALFYGRFKVHTSHILWHGVSVFPQGLVCVRVDYTVTNYDADQGIEFHDSRFTVICLDKLNKTRTQHIYSLSQLRFEPGACSSRSVTACSVYTDLHNLKSDIVRMGDSDLCVPRVKRPGNWRSVIGPSSWTPMAPLTPGQAFASLCKSITWGTLFKSRVYARVCVQVCV